MISAQNWRIPDRKLHIGISWAGSPLNDIDKHRNIPVTQFFDLYKVPGIQLYSLQKCRIATREIPCTTPEAWR